MIKLSKEEFEKQIPHNGVFVFTLHEECPLCKTYINSIKNYNWNEVVCKPKDKKWLVTNALVTGLPSTKYYVDGMCVYDQEGILYAAQLKELHQTIKRFKSG